MGEQGRLVLGFVGRGKSWESESCLVGLVRSGVKSRSLLGDGGWQMALTGVIAVVETRRWPRETRSNQGITCREVL